MTQNSLNDLRARVDDHLKGYLEGKAAECRQVSEESVELIDAITVFTMRGGKRLRPAMVGAAYRAVERGGDLGRTLDAGTALELLHGALLMHDDWMDGDETRRGGPTVHVIFREKHGDSHLGASLAILAGNLATTFAWELFARSPFPDTHRARAIAEFIEIQEKVYFGQHLDLTGSRDVWRMHDLKTTSYTARGPLRVGALLAGASDAQIEVLDRYGTAIGAAFQMRDDLLGAFGDAKTTGKGVGNDLRAGKRNAVVMQAEKVLKPADRKPIDDVLGHKYATDEEVARAVELLVTSGAKQKVEQQIAQRVEEALGSLTGSDLFTGDLNALAEAMAHRDK